MPPTLSAAALLLAVPVLLGLWLQGAMGHGHRVSPSGDRDRLRGAPGVLAGPGTPLLAPLPVGAFLCVRAAQRAPAIVRGAIILLSLLATAVLLPLLLTMDGVLHASPWMLALPALIALVDAGAGAYDACTATSREVGRSPPPLRANHCREVDPPADRRHRPAPTHRSARTTRSTASAPPWRS